MRIDSQDLLGLPVVTERGIRLGKVLSLEIDVESHAVVGYRVGSRHWPMGGTDHLIVPTQVLAITAERMTVIDTAVAADESVSRSTASPVRTISPVASSSRE